MSAQRDWAKIFVLVILAAGAALPVWQLRRAANMMTAIFGSPPTYSTSTASREFITGYDRTHIVRWRIPAAYVNSVAHYPDTPLYADRPPGAKDFIVLSFDLETLEPWAVARRRLTEPGRNLHFVEVTIHPSKPGYLERHREIEQTSQKYWTPSGERVADLIEERPVPHSHLTDWRYLPPPEDDSHVVEAQCLRFTNEDHLLGCWANAIYSDYVSLKYRFWSTDLPQWRQIDGKARQLLTSFIVAP